MGAISRKEVLHQAPYNKDDRADVHPPSAEIESNIATLVVRVNKLLRHWGDKVLVSSGYRPGVYNKNAGGAPNSAHATGEAVDLRDPEGKLDEFILANPWLLQRYDLYLEDPSRTRGWSHLSIRPTKSGKRIFMP